MEHPQIQVEKKFSGRKPGSLKKSDENQLLKKEYSKETRVPRTDNSRTASE